MRSLEFRSTLVFIALAMHACGGETPAQPAADAGDDAATSVDRPAPADVGPPLDAPPLDAPVAVDLPPSPEAGETDDVAADDAAADGPALVDAQGLDAPDAGCTSDLACAGRAEGPVCDPTTGRCVPCTASSDRCPDGQYCVAGVNRCAPGCRADSGCRGAAPRCDLTSHSCVACLSPADCATDELCLAGRCVQSCDGATPCEGSRTCCGSACVNLLSNVEHCGGCSARCAPANATPACAVGVCGIGACTAPYADCDGDAADGCEVDLAMAPSHCGACGRSCSLSHATAGCALGACTVASCDVGFGDCNRNAADGCEVDLRASTAHCGVCGRVCVLPNAIGACSAGTCVVGSCNGLNGDCDADPTNGCETSLGSLSNCGACGVTCATPPGPHTVARCATSGASASCGAACESGWTDCDGDLTNGCEVVGACTRTREVFADNFMAGVANWSLPRGSGGASFGLTTEVGACRNPTFCFGCDACLAASGYCDSLATATLQTSFDFSRVTSGLFSFYSRGGPGALDRFILEGSTDGGGTWRPLPTPPPSASSLNTASPQRVDLTSLAGARDVRFRFRFENNCDPGDVWGIGWHIDDVSVVVVERTY